MTTDLAVERFGGYESVELLGSGGFADVYRCYHRDLDSYVAVKVLHPHLAREDEIRRRFIQEAQILWRADHPRLIPVFHVDSLATGQPYFVMRLAERGSLGQLLNERMTAGAPFPLASVVGLGLELTDCIEAMRANELVHRDLKPANVLVRTVRTPSLERTDRWGLPADERLVLADFGLAKMLSEGSSLLSQMGGTPWYMAPELASLTARVDWRADLFAVAVMLFELAIGEVPWPERTLHDVREVEVDLVDAAERSGGTIPPGFDDLVRRAVMPDPDERFAAPADFSAALLELVEGDIPATVDLTERVRRTIRTSASRTGAASAAEALEALDRPVRLAVVGGERTTPEGLSLRLLGRRLEAGGGSMVGHCITWIRSAEPASISATTHRGERVDGTVLQDDESSLRLEIPCPPWSVSSLDLGLPGNRLGTSELVDVPWTVVKSDPVAAAAAVRRSDLVVVGFPASGAQAAATLDSVVGLLADPRTGPVGVVGVQAAAAWEQTPERMVGTLAIISSDDSAELRAITDDVIGSDRAALLGASAAISMLCSDATIANAPALAAEFDELRRDHPELESLRVARLAVAHRAGLSPDERDEVLSLLVRRAPQSRLRLDADVDLDVVRGSADRLLGRWQSIATMSTSTRAEVARAVVVELDRLSDRTEEER